MKLISLSLFIVYFLFSICRPHLCMAASVTNFSEWETFLAKTQIKFDELNFNYSLALREKHKNFEYELSKSPWYLRGNLEFIGKELASLEEMESILEDKVKPILQEGKDLLGKMDLEIHYENLESFEDMIQAKEQEIKTKINEEKAYINRVREIKIKQLGINKLL